MLRNTMIRITGTIPAKQDLIEKFGEEGTLEEMPWYEPEDPLFEALYEGQAITAEPFDLTYTQDGGWSDPSAIILLRIRRKMTSGRKVPVVNWRGGDPSIRADLLGTEEQAAATFMALANKIHPKIMTTHRNLSIMDEKPSKLMSIHRNLSRIDENPSKFIQN